METETIQSLPLLLTDSLICAVAQIMSLVLCLGDYLSRDLSWYAQAMEGDLFDCLAITFLPLHDLGGSAC